MPRDVGLRACLNILFYLSVLPSPLLALRLDVPTQSSDGKTIYLKWAEDAEDPKTVYMLVICSLVPLGTSVRVQVSDRQASLEVVPGILKEIPSIGCRVYASDDDPPLPGNSIAQSDIFRSLEVGPPSISSTPSDLSTPIPTKTRMLSSSKSAPVAATTPFLHPGGSRSESTSNGASASIKSPSAGGPDLSLGTTEIRPSFGASTTATPGTSPSPGITGPIPTTSANIMGGEPESARRTSSRGALIGGTLGGLALLVSFIICLFLYLRRKKKRSSFTIAIVPPRQRRRITEDHNGTFRDLQDTRTHIHNVVEAARNAIGSCVSSPFRRQVIHSLIVNPLIQRGSYRPPESKHERLERVLREMEESRRQREMLQYDLDNRSNSDRVRNGSEVRLDGEFERLRQRIEAMSRRIEELEAERLEVEAPPPDYYSSVPGR